MAGSPFDLDQFAPAAVSFKLRGVEYFLDADPDVDFVAKMLRVEAAIGTASDTGDADAIVAAIQEGKKMLVELMLAADVDQDVSTVKFNTQQVMTLFSLVLQGPSVAAVVAQAISMPEQEGKDGQEPVATPPGDQAEDAADADAAPLASGSTSREPSSSSEETGAGLLVTGTA